MNTFNDIEFLWKSVAKTEVPDIGKIISKSTSEKNAVAKKIKIQVFFMLLAFINIICVGYFFNFQYSSSYIGMGLMLLLIAAFSVVRSKQVRDLQQLDFSNAPISLLEKLETFHRKQKWLNTVGTRWYNVLLNVAFGFYFYEMIYKAPLTNTIKLIILAIYVSWMVIAIFWIGKRSIRKEHERIGGIIEKIKGLQKDLSNN